MRKLTITKAVCERAVFEDTFIVYLSGVVDGVEFAVQERIAAHVMDNPEEAVAYGTQLCLHKLIALVEPTEVVYECPPKFTTTTTDTTAENTAKTKVITVNPILKHYGTLRPSWNRF